MADESKSQILIALATRLGIPSDEQAVQRKILAELDAGAEARKQLEAILAALGVKDQPAALAKIVDQIKSSQALLDAMPQLEALKEAKVKDEEKAVDEDVDKAMAAHRLPPEAREAMRFMRKGGVELTKESPSEAWERRLAARAAFATQYPLPAQSEAHLLATIAVPRPAEQGQVMGTQVPSRTSTADAVFACAGRNVTEQAMAFVRSQAGGAKLSHEDAHEAACALLAELRSQGVALPKPPGRRLDIPTRN
jgi:hypothetical protein